MTGAEEPEPDAWSIVVTSTGADSAPAPFREVLVVEDARGRPALRAITDANGALAIDGITANAVHVAPLNAPSRRVTFARGAIAGAVAIPGDLVMASGRWRGAGEDATPVIGGVLVLVAADPAVAAKGRAFGTRAFPVAITDVSGTFRFPAVEPGAYVLRTDRATEHPITIESDATLEIAGTGGDEGVVISTVD